MVNKSSSTTSNNLYLRGLCCLLLVPSTTPFTQPSLPLVHRRTSTIYHDSPLGLTSGFSFRLQRITSLPSSSGSDDAATSETADDSNNDIPPSVLSASERVEDCKRDLIQMCDTHALGSGYSAEIQRKIRDLEQLGEDVSFSMNTFHANIFDRSTQ